MYKATRRQTLKLALLAALGASSMTAPEARAADATFMRAALTLYFVHEFRLYKERWYWIDKATIRCRFMIRLAFDPLTRRYRLSYNGLSLSFDTLEQALPYIKNIRRWRVGPSNAVRNAEDYAAELRFYLDTDKLPKPMQVVNTGSSDWTLTSDWIELPIPAEVIAPAD